MSRKKNTEKELHWRKMVDRQVGSGLSIRRYCAKEGISQPSFYAWRKRLRERKHDGRQSGDSRRDTDGHGGDHDFIPLKLRDSASALEVIHPLGYQVRVTGEVNRTALRQVLEVLDGRGDR
jgi:transposase-like protein